MLMSSMVGGALRFGLGIYQLGRLNRLAAFPEILDSLTGTTPVLYRYNQCPTTPLLLDRLLTMRGSLLRLDLRRSKVMHLLHRSLATARTMAIPTTPSHPTLPLLHRLRSLNIPMTRRHTQPSRRNSPSRSRNTMICGPRFSSWWISSGSWSSAGSR